MKKIIIAISFITIITGCNDKQSFVISSTDSFDAISKKTKLIDKHESEYFDSYSSKDQLEGIDDIQFTINPLDEISYKFSKKGNFCGFIGDLSTVNNVYTKDELIEIFKKLEHDFNKKGVAKVSSLSKTNLTWELNRKSGIKYISLDLGDYEDNSFLTLMAVTDAERYCDPNVMEQEKKGEWITRESDDPIDDSKVYYAEILSNSKAKESLLILRCQNNSLDIYLAVDDYLGIGKSTVSFRVDKNKAITDQWDIASKGNYVYYTGDAKSLFKSMLNANELTTRVRTYEGQITSTFNLDKIGYASKDIVKECSILTNNQARLGDFEILLFTFSNLGNAEKAKNKLVTDSYNAYIKNDGKVFRVFIGYFANQKEAEIAQKQLFKKYKEKGIIIKVDK